jgi:hypothetical protein
MYTSAKYLLKKVFVLVLCVQFSTTVLAKASELSQQDEAVYVETIKVCQYYQPSDTLNIVYESAKEGLLDQRILNLNLQLSKQLDSPGFYKALFECYPNDEASRNLFISSLILADVSGKLISIVGYLGAFKIISKLFHTLKSFSSSAYKTTIVIGTLWMVVDLGIEYNKFNTNPDQYLIEHPEYIELQSSIYQAMGKSFVTPAAKLEQRKNIELAKAEMSQFDDFLKYACASKKAHFTALLKEAKNIEEANNIQTKLHSLALIPECQ